MYTVGIATCSHVICLGPNPATIIIYKHLTVRIGENTAVWTGKK